MSTSNIQPPSYSTTPALLIQTIFFMSLPGESRNQIYDAIIADVFATKAPHVSDESVVTNSPDAMSIQPFIDGNFGLRSGFRMANKQIYKELTSRVFSSSNSTFFVPRNAFTIPNFRTLPNIPILHRIEHLCIDAWYCLLLGEKLIDPRNFPADYYYWTEGHENNAYARAEQIDDLAAALQLKTLTLERRACTTSRPNSMGDSFQDTLIDNVQKNRGYTVIVGSVIYGHPLVLS